MDKKIIKFYDSETEELKNSNFINMKALFQ